MSDSTPTFDDRTALVVVDVQNNVAHPNGNLYVDGGDRTIPGLPSGSWWSAWPKTSA